MNNPHLYNIRLTHGYINFIKKHYPDIDINSLLEYAEINPHELEDLGYWYTQRQSDLFHEIIVKKTGNVNISRDAARFASNIGTYNLVRQYMLGFITVEAAYLALEHITSKLTRAGLFKARKIGRNKMEAISRPYKDVIEKPYQCEVRIGMLEAIPTMSGNKFADVEHPLCIHRGDDYCKYIVSWHDPASFKLKLIRNYLSLFSLLLSLASFIFLSIFNFAIILLFCSSVVLVISNYYERLKNKELVRSSESQGNTAEQLLEEINNRFNNALLVQEIGQAISSILDLENLFKSIMQILEKRTDFDRGVILLENDNATRLNYKTGYGYDQTKEQILKDTEFHLDRPESKGIFVKAFKEQKAFLINDVNEIIADVSDRSKYFTSSIGTKSFITVPIIFKEKSLGILVVDNISNKRPLTMSDMNMLSGIAQQIGISINNARSFLQLQASEEKYRELVEFANSIIIRIDTEGKIVFFNEFAQKFSGYTEEELLGRKLTDVVLSDDSQYENKFQKMLNEIGKYPDRYQSIQTENIIKNMKKVCIAWTNRPVFDSEENLKEILCVGNDITELKTGEEKIRHLNEVLLTIRNIDQLITQEKDRNTLIKGICDELVQTRGHGGAWIILFDKNDKFDRAYESGFKGVFQIFLEKFRKNIAPECYTKSLSQPGTVVINDPHECNNCEFNSTYCQAGRMLNRLKYNDKIYGIMSVEIDPGFISNEDETLLLKEVADEIAFALYSIDLEEDRKRLQDQLFQSAKLSAVGQLAAGIAHEFNNILHVILGHAQLSLSGNFIQDPDIKESIQHIEKATTRGRGIVKRLSEFAKPQDPEFEIQDIADVIQETVKLQKKQIQVENIDVKQEFGEHSDVLFDRNQIGQVFLNLLNNSIHAIKFKGSGNIIISLMDTDKNLEIRFSDTGTGMSSEVMKKIFEPFFSTKGAWAKDNLGITGTGLGLSVTHAIIKQHNGTISVESEEGKGTTFIIKLPIPEEKDVKKIKNISNKADIDNKKAKYLKIMVVDDEEEMISLMNLIFKKNGYNNFIGEKKASQAGRIFREFVPDVVFLDMLMPGINGVQVFEELKLINRTVPVVFMTGKLNGMDNEYKNIGAYDFLKKPFTADNIFSILNKIAGEKEKTVN